MFWYTYILFCDQKIFYVGLTNSLRKRVGQHKKKQSPYTKKFSDIKLVYFEKHKLRSQAKEREKQIKNWSIAKKKSLIRGDIELLKKLSKSHKIGE